MADLFAGVLIVICVILVWEHANDGLLGDSTLAWKVYNLVAIIGWGTLALTYIYVLFVNDDLRSVGPTYIRPAILLIAAAQLGRLKTFWRGERR